MLARPSRTGSTLAGDRTRRQLERLLDEAEEAFGRGEWELLRERAERALLLDPENSDARNFQSAAERALSGDLQSRSQQAAPPASEPQPTHPSSFSDGRYQVKELLGEGGKKRVFLAHDTLLDRDVAFGLIKTEDLDEKGRTRISREAQAWDASAHTPTSSPSSTWETMKANPTWSPSSWAVAMSKALSIALPTIVSRWTRSWT